MHIFTTYNYIFVVLFGHTFEYSDHYKVKKLGTSKYCWWKNSCTSWGWSFIPLFTRFFTSQAVSRISFITSINLCPPGGWSAFSRLHRNCLRIANTFEPDLVLVSAGFDAAPGDPLGPGIFWEDALRIWGTATHCFGPSLLHRSMSWKERILHGDILDIEWSYYRL